jgi:predicted O-methyltransferase YrrM
MSKLTRDKKKSKKRRFKLLRTIGLRNIWRIWRRRINKHVLVTKSVSDYVELFSAEAMPKYLVDLYNTSLREHNGGMQIELSEALFLDLLVRITAAKSILEIGTFRGWSAAVLAHALYDMHKKDGDGGYDSGNSVKQEHVLRGVGDVKIKTIELRKEQASKAQIFWKSHLIEDVHTLIELIPGNAQQIIQDFDKDYVCTLNLIFIDADKAGYENYIRILAPNLNSGTLIVLDNMLNAGLVATSATDRTSVSIRELNKKLITDTEMKEWFDVSLIPAWDGVVILRKK